MITIYLITGLVTSPTPRFIPIPIPLARYTMKQWLEESIANDDRPRMQELTQNIRKFDVKPSKNIGSVGILLGRKITCMALIEKNEDQIHIWHIESYDMFSGTLLLKYMTDNVCFSFTPNIHPRWKIAISYFKSP